MKTKRFTLSEGQQEELRNCPHVKKVSARTVQFTADFKRQAIGERARGKPLASSSVRPVFRITLIQAMPLIVLRSGNGWLRNMVSTTLIMQSNTQMDYLLVLDLLRFVFLKN